MNPDSVYQRLRELSWRRPLTAAEQADLRAWLMAHPEALAEAEAELALNQALARLPDAPMPSNFTARVRQAIEQEAAIKIRTTTPRPPWSWRGFVPRFAMATVVVGALVLAYQHRQAAQQAEWVKSFLAGASPALADPKVIADFEVIRQLSPATAADEELLKLLE